MYWVIMAHGNVYRLIIGRNFLSTLDIILTPGISTVVVAGYYAVDVFFWVGGFLLTIGLA